MAPMPYRDPFTTRAPEPVAASRPIGWGPGLHATLRIGAGLLFMMHGLQKHFGLFGGETVPIGSLLGLAGVLELVGGLLVGIGLFTRPVAAILVLEMLAAIAIVHLPRGWSPLESGAELPLLYALIFAFLATNGPGPASVDTSRAGP